MGQEKMMTRIVGTFDGERVIGLYQSEEVVGEMYIKCEDEYWRKSGEDDYDLVIGVKSKDEYELPQCPKCLDRLDFVNLKRKAWKHCLTCQVVQDSERRSRCAMCRSERELWACLVCGQIGCGRYEEEHAKDHYDDSKHCLSIQLSTQRIWDYSKDIYVHKVMSPYPKVEEQANALRNDYETILEVQLSLQRDFYEEATLQDDASFDHNDFGLDSAEAELAILSTHLLSTTKALQLAKQKHAHLLRLLASHTSQSDQALNLLHILQSQSKQKILQFQADIRDLSFHQSHL